MIFQFCALRLRNIFFRDYPLNIFGLIIDNFHFDFAISFRSKKNTRHLQLSAAIIRDRPSKAGGCRIS